MRRISPQAGSNGVELCRELRSRMPDLCCLILTSFADHEAMAGAVMAGAAGFVIKDVVAVELVEAIRTVGAGGSLISPNTSSALMAQWQHQQDTTDSLDQLTDRERTILQLISEGLTNRQIADHLFLAEKTVRKPRLPAARQTRHPAASPGSGAGRPDETLAAGNGIAQEETGRNPPTDQPGRAGHARPPRYERPGR